MLIDPKDFSSQDPKQIIKFGATREDIIRGLLKAAKCVADGSMLVQGVDFCGSISHENFTKYSFSVEYAENEGPSSSTAVDRQTVRDLIGSSGLLR